MLTRYATRALVTTVACSATLAALPASTQAMTPQSMTRQSMTPNTQNRAPATIQVQNDRKVPVTVFIERGDFDVRLGKVDAMRTATLTLPDWVLAGDSRVEIFVHPEGEFDLASQSFEVTPGARLGMVVQPFDAPAWSPAPDDSMSAVLDCGDLKATTVTVENPRKEPVTVYVEQGDFDIRIGSVHAGQTKTLRIPETIAEKQDDVELFVAPEHGLDLSSQAFQLTRGAHLGLKVPRY